MQGDGWIYCEECGKKLLQRKPNGTFVFKFGRTRDNNKPSVEIEMIGSIKIKCFREEKGKECGHVNVLSFFPQA